MTELPVWNDALEEEYRQFFHDHTGHPPYKYQGEVASALFAGRNIILRAPTGAGKTKAVLLPYFFAFQKGGPLPRRLIYALPLRTLAQGIFREARDLAAKLGLPVNDERELSESKRELPFVTLQTGEQPDDPYFTNGNIIITTYDQVLSGLLHGPYGLSSSLHNLNAAAVVGALVVFDEFHLMPTQRAFLTAVASLRLYRGLCQSVWMTATATQPLERELRVALDVYPIPNDDTAAKALHDSLPSVTTVTRHIRVKRFLLSADVVLQYAEGRSLVLLNTVSRAQSIYTELRNELRNRHLDIPLILLHSRFFKTDRQQKEAQLRLLFGKGAKGPAILVATQVVEAGLDLSCDHLHTELCPMSSLVQRAGRCARFEGETGVIHVYPLPENNGSWLPYGDARGEDATLTNTRNILAEIREARLDPSLAASWVQQAHGDSDDQALRAGWRSRLTECLGRIEQNALKRDPKSVAEFIRGENSDTVRVIVSETPPDTPAKRDAIGLRRWSLARLLQNGARDTGWFWRWDDETWQPLQSVNDLARTYVVCFRPAVMAYDAEVGLQPGVSGVQESPKREEPPRPGWAALREERWVDHSQRVAAEAKRRLDAEALAGFLGSAFQQRYGLAPAALQEAATACALLHDLGKLQATWQRWAEAAQRSKHPGYQYTYPLAHTDFDGNSSEEREREKNLGIRRPPHAPASAYYGRAFLTRLLPSVPTELRGRVASACMAAILAHHGGWLSEQLGRDLQTGRLCAGWDAALAEVLGWSPDTAQIKRLEELQDKRGAASAHLQLSTHPENLADWWPLVAYLTRTLRLSDWHATREGANYE